MRPSPSKLDLAAACSYPWSSGLRWPRSEAGPAAELGTEVHRALRAWVEQRPHDALSPEAAPLVATGIAQLEREQPWTHAELLVGLDPVLWTARVRATREDRHPGEAVGELDLVRVEPDRLTIRDWKTGRRSLGRRVADLRQVRWYALVGAMLWPGRRIRVELATITEDACVIDAHEVDEWDIAAWEGDLERVYASCDRVSLPVMGPHCRDLYCPIVATCPAVREHAAAVAEAAQVAPVVPVVDAATARQAALGLPALEAYLEAVRSTLREHAAREPVDLGDGRELRLVEQPGRRSIVLDDASEAMLIDACGTRDVVERSASFAGLRRALGATSKRGELGRRLSAVEQRLEEMGAVVHGAPYTKMEITCQKG